MINRNATIKATPNYSAKTFTIRKYQNGKCYTKYRTVKLPAYEFNNCLYNTEIDWYRFLMSEDYYRVK